MSTALPTSSPHFPAPNPELKTQDAKDGFWETETVKINPAQFMVFINMLVATGSELFRIEISDINVYGTQADVDSEDPVGALLRAGSPLLDIFAYLSLKDRSKVTLQDSTKSPLLKEKKNTFTEVARALYFFFFMYLVRGTPGDDDAVVAGPLVPKFLTTIMKFSGKIASIRMIIASFDLRKLPGDWIKLVEIKNLGTETKQRLALQVAGYRMMKPFLYFEPNKPGHEKYRVAVEAIRDFYNNGVVWDAHSVTRTAAFTAAVGPLNANMANLMLECYTDATLKEMAANQLIFQVPQKKYGFTQYLSYTKATFAPFKDKIFKDL